MKLSLAAIVISFLFFTLPAKAETKFCFTNRIITAIDVGNIPNLLHGNNDGNAIQLTLAKPDDLSNVLIIPFNNATNLDDAQGRGMLAVARSAFLTGRLVTASDSHTALCNDIDRIYAVSSNWGQ